MTKPTMGCGHTANAQKGDGSPLCVICYGIVPGADEVAETPNLEGRMAECTCNRRVPSDTQLPFFEHTPNKEFDRYYCGCYGWD